MRPHEFWQEILPADAADGPPHVDRFPARLPDGRVLMLPIRPLAGTENAIASLIVNQASFAVEAALADALASRLAGAGAEVVVGMPTLGLSLARLVAERLGHARYVPLGTSRKFWYDDALSVPLRSITSPGSGKRLFVDPRMQELLTGRRICLIDDVISSGTSICAGLDVLDLVGVHPVAIGCAMLQTRRWQARLQDRHQHACEIVAGAMETPLLRRVAGGWDVQPETGPA